MRTSRILLMPLAIAIATAVALAAPVVPAQGEQGNVGTIKVHDDEETNPPQRNVPHVSCDFYIEGFNMRDDSGTLKFFAWPPTGDKEEVTPTGDDLSWTSDGTNEQGNHHFMKGPYFLPEGHYRVEAYGDEPHPGNPNHFAKTKTFWVDPCEEEPADLPCPAGVVAVSANNGDITLTWTPVVGVEAYNVYRAVGDEDFEYLATVEDTTYVDTTTEGGVTYSYYVTSTNGTQESVGCEEVEVTAIPFFPTLAVGAIATLGAVGAFVMLRRRS